MKSLDSRGIGAYALPMTQNATCTVVTNGNGGRCGNPAVTTFKARNGETFAECAEHTPTAYAARAEAPFAVGSSVKVRHIGIVKVGTVVKVGRTRVTVRVPLSNGNEKEISVSVGEIL